MKDNENKKSNLICEHCQILGHKKESSYMLVGYPLGHKLHKYKKNNITNQKHHFAANQVDIPEGIFETTDPVILGNSITHTFTYHNAIKS